MENQNCKRSGPWVVIAVRWSWSKLMGTEKQRESIGFRSFFLSFFFCLMWTIFKVFIEFVTICFCFMFWYFGQEACEILAPWPGIEPTPPALENEVLGTGLQGKSRLFLFLCTQWMCEIKERDESRMTCRFWLTNWVFVIPFAKLGGNGKDAGLFYFILVVGRWRILL